MSADTSARENIKKIKRHRLLFMATLIAIIIYLSWRTFFSIPTRYGFVALAVSVLLLISEMMAAIEAVVNFSMMSKNIPPELPEIDPSWYPEVDILITTHNESVDTLYPTINACTFLKYPDKSKVHIHLCDDTARPEMEELAKQFGVNYWGMSNNKDNKGGNINNAARQTHAPIVVTFDADMVPRREFLMKTVPYFFLPKMKKNEKGIWVPKEENEIDPKEKIGFVQTPQGFYNPDLFQYNLYSEGRIPSEQDLFFREINVSRSAYNAPIYAGSNTLISREALEDVNYIAVDTITEDILTGLRIQKAGYRCYATPEVLANGQAPINVKALLKQRERWGRGCIDALRQEPIIFTRKLTFMQKVSYLASWVYWYSFLRRAIFLIVPIFSILFNLHAVESGVWQVLVLWLPYYLLLNRSLRVLSGDVWNQHWSNVADTVVFPYMIGPILKEQVGIKMKSFSVTDKNVTATYARSTFIYALPHIVFLIAALISLFIAIGKSIQIGGLYNPLIIFWLVIGIKNLLFAIFFMWGRDSNRIAARFYFSAPVRVAAEGRLYEGTTTDASESGLAFYLDSSVYIPPDKPLEVHIEDRGLQADLKTSVVHIAPSGEKGWKYSVSIDEIDDAQRRQYTQIIYDRPHSLPKKLDPSLSLVDDFNLQLGKRIAAPQDSMRKLPRVILNVPFTDRSGEKGVLVDFNYHYATIQGNDRPQAGQALVVTLARDFELILEPAFDDFESNNLYRVRNAEEFIEDPATPEKLDLIRALDPVGKASLAATARVVGASLLDNAVADTAADTAATARVVGASLLDTADNADDTDTDTAAETADETADETAADTADDTDTDTAADPADDTTAQISEENIIAIAHIRDAHTREGD